MIDLQNLRQDLSRIPTCTIKGKVVEASPSLITAHLCKAAIGDIVTIYPCHRTENIPELKAEVIGFKKDVFILSPLGTAKNIIPGSIVECSGKALEIPVSKSILGTIVDAMGQRIYGTEFDTDPSSSDIGEHFYAIHNPPPSPSARKNIDKVFSTGVRAIDGFLTLGQGQRICIIAPPGVGKTSLMGMITNNAFCDVNVIALVGERGREVQELISRVLSPEIRKKTVVVVSTSDQAPALRASAALTATRIAEYFRDKGLNVLLQMDSLTRLIRAYRELGISSGEIPIRNGYPASVFTRIPDLIERAGQNHTGSITALYTILSSSSAIEDPIVDEIKGFTDGHIVLSKELAEKRHFPAIDVLSSVSRLSTQLVPENVQPALNTLSKVFVQLRDKRQYIELYDRQSDEMNFYLEIESELMAFLQQAFDVKSSFAETLDRICDLAKLVSENQDVVNSQSSLARKVHESPSESYSGA